MDGAVTMTGDAFTVALAGPGAALARSIAPETSPECRAQLGDRRCRVDLAPLTSVAVVASVTGEVVVLDNPVGPLGPGTLRWLDGGNGGIARAIVASDGESVTLREPPPFAAAAGTRVRLVQGCDKRFATCRDVFANAANFQGEPHLPGNDLLTRYGE